MKMRFAVLIVVFFAFIDVTNANPIKLEETNTGRQIYSVSESALSALYNTNEDCQLNSVFDVIYEKAGRPPSKNYILQYKLNSKTFLYFYPSVRFCVNQHFWQLSAVKSPTSNTDGSCQLSWSLPPALQTSLLSSEQPVVIRLFYKTTAGDQYQDLILSKNFVRSIKRMYSLPNRTVMFVAF